MAFSTIQGSGGAPDSFVGTSGVDAIAVIDSNGGYFLGGNASNDSIALNTTGNPLYSRAVSNSTLKGGLGEDTFTFTSANATTYVAAFLNGNGDDDTFNLAAGDFFLTSTLKGGAGEDTIEGDTADFTSSVVNGNKADDEINLDGDITSSSIYGGEGDDEITLATATDVTNSLISGDLGNDAIDGSVAGKDFSGSTVQGGAGNDTIDLTAGGVTGTVTINGNEGVDIINGTDAGDAVIFGGTGNDIIDAEGAETTITGGAGSDTIELDAAGADEVVSYTAIDQGGDSSSATDANNLDAGDVITNFESTEDHLNFAAASLVGVDASAVADGGLWNMNDAGVAFDTTTNAAATTYTAAAAAVGNVTGDAGDTGYYVQEIVTEAVAAAAVYNVFQVTLGTDKANTGLNAADTISLVGRVTMASVNENIAAGDFSFVG